MKHIPLSELQYTFSRSSGAGGQHVNKTATKVTVHWSVGKSSSFSDEQKRRIRSQLINRLNSQDEVVVTSEEERSQAQNKLRATAKIRSLVKDALRIPKKRIATKPTKAAKERRLESKRKRSQVKKMRTRGLGSLS